MPNKPYGELTCLFDQDGGICGDRVKMFLMLTLSIESAFKWLNGTDKNTFYHKML